MKKLTVPIASRGLNMERHPESIMNKIAILILILAMAVGLGGCNTIKSTAPTESTKITRTIYVPMTGVSLEYFDFRKGDSVVGSFAVQGKYPVSASIVYVQPLKAEGGQTIDVASAPVFSVEDSMWEAFTFAVPVSAKYRFAFSGYFAKIRSEDWKPYSQLKEEVNLELTIHHED